VSAGQVTSLAADAASPLLAAGYSDGCVRSFDPRAPPAAAVVAQLVVGRGAVSAVSIQPAAPAGRLAAAAASGEIWLVDPRRLQGGAAGVGGGEGGDAAPGGWCGGGGLSPGAALLGETRCQLPVPFGGEGAVGVCSTSLLMSWLR